MMQSLQQVSPPLQAELKPLVDRWNAFVPKIRARVDEVVAEADQGIDALIAQHATDFGPMGTAFGTIDARFRGLEQKARDAGDQVEEAVWEVIFRDGLSPHDHTALNRFHTDVTREIRALPEQIEMTCHQLKIDKAAAWARKLYELANADMQKPINCTQCSAQMKVQTFWQASNETCPHCNGVNALTPSAAIYAYFGQGVHALAEHASLAAWQQEQQARTTLDNFRHPTAYDHWQWMEAARNYWTTYYQHYANMHPGFAAAHGTLEAAVAAKIKHYTQHDPPQEQQARDFLGHMVNAAQNNNAAGVQQMLQAMPQGIDVDDCVNAMMERHNEPAARLLLGFQYQMEGETDPREAWIQEQLRDHAEQVRNR